LFLAVEMGDGDGEGVVKASSGALVSGREPKRELESDDEFSD
jgi:hypothetical protein